ncbi:MAG: hypothetical protein ACOCSE_06535, partial [Chitinivibrionales bacterium]
MKKVNPFSILLIAVVSITAIWFLLPSFAFYSKTPEERRETVAEDPSILNNIINLGLDLQGGMRLVLEVDRSSLSKEEQEGLLDRAYTIIENRINGLGVTEPTIQKQGDNRIIVELPGLSNKEVAKQVIGSTAQLEFLLVRKPDEISRAISIIDRTLAQLAKSGSSKEPE